MGELNNSITQEDTLDTTPENPSEASTETTVETSDSQEENSSGTGSGDAVSGGTDSGDAVSGGTDSGDAVSGGSDSGGSDSGGSDSGGTDSGGTDSGDAVSGGSDSGDTNSGDTSPKETAAKETTAKDANSQSEEFDSSSGSGSSGILVAPAENISEEETTGENSSASASEASTEETSAEETYTETQAPGADTGAAPFSGGMLYAILALLLVLIIGVALTIIRKNNEKKRRRRKRRTRPSPSPRSDDLITAVGTDPTLATAPIAAVHQPVVAAVHQHIGAREDQQDSYGASDLNAYPVQGVLAVVADGMGGLSNGGAVSSALVHTFLDGFRRMAGQVQPQDILLEMTIQANGYINQMLRGAERSGSTLVSAVIREGYLHFLTVGDSRIYLFRGGTLLQLNREHIYQEELAVKAVNRLISIPQVSGDRQAHSLTSYFGIGQIPSIDRNYEGIKLVSGDRILLATDGVFGTLTQEQMEQALQGTVGEAAKAIGDMVREADQPYQDNNTALILEYRG